MSLLFEFYGTFPCTKEAAYHGIRGYAITGTVPENIPFDRTTITAVLAAERRRERKNIGEQVFCGTPTHRIKITAYPRSQTATALLNIPLSLDDDGDRTLTGILNFLYFYGKGLDCDRPLLEFGACLIYPRQILLEPSPHTRIFWVATLLTSLADNAIASPT